MITLKTVKDITSTLKRSEPLRVAVIDHVAQIWSPTSFQVDHLDKVVTGPLFILELPLAEVAPEVREKYKNEPVPLESILAQSGYEKSDVDDLEKNGWRALLAATEGEPAVGVRETVHQKYEDGTEEDVEVVKLTAKSGEWRYVQAPFYDFFAAQLLQPGFRIQKGEQWAKVPTPITVWDGHDLVGIVGAYEPDWSGSTAA